MLRWLERRRRPASPGESRGLTVTVVEGDRPIPWRHVPRLDDARPDDRVFALDPDTGAVVFGDGRHGRRPPGGATIRVHLSGTGAAGNVGGYPVRMIDYEFRLGLVVGPRTPPGQIRQIMPADGWALVEHTSPGERLTPLVGWALLDPYVPPYRDGGEPYTPAEQTVRGLIAPRGGPVRIVDELAGTFAGYRQA